MCGGDICFSGMQRTVIGLPTLWDIMSVPTVRVKISSDDDDDDDDDKHVCGRVFVRSILFMSGLR